MGKFRRSAVRVYPFVCVLFVLCIVLTSKRWQYADNSLSGYCKSLFTPGEIVFLTIADSGYSGMMLNTAMALSKGHAHFLAICMDAGCMKICRKNRLHCFEGIGQSVGRLKFGTVRELLAAGYHTLLLDLDLFVVKNPFAALRPLSDDWDIQVQQDVNGAPNIGFILSRATPEVTKLWAAVEQAYIEHPETLEDSNAYKGQVKYGELLRASGLKVHLLSLDEFQSWMFHDKLKFYDSENVPDETVILHMTCAEGSYKDHLGKSLGLFHEALGYYCNPRPTLEVELLAWEGTTEHLAAQLALLLEAAKQSGRSFVPPKWVWLQRDDDKHKLPFIRAFSLLSGPIKDVEVLEHNYYMHQALECRQGLLLNPQHLRIMPNESGILAIQQATAKRLVVELRSEGSAVKTEGFPKPDMCDIDRALQAWDCLQDCP